MKYNLFIVLSILTVIFFSPLTLAAWTTDDPPHRPLRSDSKKTCSEWIIYHGFLEGNHEENGEKASGRASKLDGDAFSWAVGYAYVLSSIHVLNLSMREGNTHALSNDLLSNVYLSPRQFCAGREIRELKVFFSDLKRELKTCKDWLFLYGYDLENSTLNWQMAPHRNFMFDGDISHWVAGYGQLLCSVSESGAISPATYCYALGVDANALSPFITRRETVMNCENWLQLYGFSENAERNYIKAHIAINPLYLDHIHYLVKLFTSYLYNIGYFVDIKPSFYCYSLGLREPVPFFA